MQASLFPDLPPLAGFRLVEDFLSRQEEADLLERIGRIALVPARYKAYTARRLVAAFGGRFDYDSNVLHEAPEIPPSLAPLRERVAAWLGVEAERFAQMLVAAYPPGTPLGWHRDVPEFESIVGLSLTGPARLRLRPYPPPTGRSRETFSLELPPRSIYVIEGDARWGWQHAIAPTPALRHSISLRTPRGSAPLLPRGA